MEYFNKFKPEQKKKLILAAIAGIIITFFAGINDLTAREKGIAVLKRPEVYEDSKSCRLTVKAAGRDGSRDEFDFAGMIHARKASDDEIDAFLDQAMEYYGKSFIRKGESRKAVRSGINIPKSIPKNPCSFEFSCDVTGAFSDEGNINTSIVKGEMDTTVTLTVVYDKDNKLSKKYAIHLAPDGSMPKETVEESVKNVLNTILEGDDIKKEIPLPKAIGGIRVKFFEPQELMAPKCLMLSVFVVMALAFVYKDRNEEKSVKKRAELKEAYADFAGRVVILLGAGLTMSEIIRKLAKEKGKETALKKELQITVRQMDNGMTEREAYESFGKRCADCPDYMKFSSILIESLRLGAGRLLDRLSDESETALEKRKNNAAENGSKADTKMLLPMMLQLVLVMAMIMVPAFMTAQ